NTYTSGPSNPFGAVTADSEQTSLYATYTSSSPPTLRPTNTALPMISGTAAVGQPLSASTGSWSESPTRYEYQWQRCDSSGESCAPTPVPTTTPYRSGTSTAGTTHPSAATTTDSDHPSPHASYAPTAPPPPRPTNTALPMISGTAAVGQPL